MSGRRARKRLRHCPATGPWRGPQSPAMHSRAASVDRQPLDPHGKSHRGDGLGAAETRQQIVIAAAGDEWIAAALRVGQFEYKTGVVVETARERGREAHAFHVDSVRGEEPRAVLEQVERGSEGARKIGIAGKR